MLSSWRTRVVLQWGMENAGRVGGVVPTIVRGWRHSLSTNDGKTEAQGSGYGWAGPSFYAQRCRLQKFGTSVPSNKGL